MKLSNYLGLAVLMLFSSLCVLPAYSQQPAPGDKNVLAAHTEVPPRIDGHVDDLVWQQAMVIDDLHMIKPNEYDEPTERSEIRVLFDDTALYVAARFFDSEPQQVIAKSMRQGALSMSDDLFSMIIDPFNRGRGAYIFELNPNGVRSEAVFTSVTERNYNWQGIWSGAARQDDLGWTAEMKIPFKTLSFDPTIDSWGVNFSRWIARKNEAVGWVSRNRNQDPSNAGRLDGLQGMTQGAGLDVIPAIRAGRSKTFSSGQTSVEFEPSLDVRYRVTPALTASLTANTDFTGTSVDARQINLSRFGLFFPEKRKFFLQDADIFEYGMIGTRDLNSTLDRVARHNGRPFFSRRIGLSESGEPIDVIVGAKLTGRVGRWDVAAQYMQQDAYQDLDSQNLFVGRATAEVLEESSIGAIVTSGDPSSNLDNTLAGVDLRYLNTRLAGGRTFLGSAWYQQSNTQDLHGNDVAYGVSVKWPNNQGLRGEINAKSLQQNFKPGLGYTNRTGVSDYSTEFGYTWRPNAGRFRSIYAGLSAQRIEKIGGGTETERVFVRTLELENHHADKLFTWYLYRKERVDQPFEISPGIFIAPGQYSFGSACASVSSGGQRVISTRLFACDGDFYDGRRTQTGFDFTWLPSPHFMFALSYSQNDIRLMAGEFDTKLATVKADIAFNSSWSWESYIQYDNISEDIGINSILRWIPSAGREMVLVINHEMGKSVLDRHTRSQSSSMTLKWSHTFRF